MANSPSYIDMDVNCDIIRKRSTFSSKISSRESFVILNILFTLYHKRIEINNNLPDKNIQDPVNSSQLSCNNSVEVDKLVRKVANNYFSGDLQCVQNKILALKNTPKLQGKDVSVNNPNIYLLQDTINI